MMTIWICPRCSLRREIEVSKQGAGVPACPTDQTPMVASGGGPVSFPGSERFDEIFVTGPCPTLPGLAEALASRDPELAQEPPIE